jgi:hypothetical protein
MGKVGDLVSFLKTKLFPTEIYKQTKTIIFVTDNVTVFNDQLFS